MNRPWEDSCPKCGYLTSFGPTTFRVTYVQQSELLLLTCRQCGYNYYIPCLDAEKKKEKT